MTKQSKQQIVETTKYLAVKVGTNVLTTKDGLLNLERIHQLVEEICAIRERGVCVALVSSGAVGAGMGRLGLSARPKFYPELQAVAAIGQGTLIQYYEQELNAKGVLAAQVLLTAGDLSQRERYLNTRNAFNSLFDYGALPIVNENDAVSSAELSLTFGDNDRLASLVANLFPSPLLVLLTDVDGLFTGDPSLPESKLVPEVERWSADLMGMVAEKKSSRSKGGMSSKLKAARTVTNAGGAVIIANGDDPQILSKIYSGEEVGTFFYPQGRQSARKRWLSSARTPSGFLVVDDGAVKALVDGGKSLLPVGVVLCSGDFKKGDVVSIVDGKGREIARGLTNYSSKEGAPICGFSSHKIVQKFGRESYPYEEFVHRDNIQLNK
ncbi:MAG: glutamate 5-kinase [Thermoguttaceae bacterium]|nr:glutamate 5-kinase [Thermoguttaceae bacterium]